MASHPLAQWFIQSLKRSYTRSSRLAQGACKACGQFSPIMLGKCTGCGTPVELTATTTQLIRTYKGGGMERAFQREAARLARLGWSAGTPAYSGTAGPGVAKVAAFGVFAYAGGRKPKQMTVVYSRSAPHV